MVRNADKSPVQDHDDEKLLWRSKHFNTQSIAHLGLRPSAYTDYNKPDETPGSVTRFIASIKSYNCSYTSLSIEHWKKALFPKMLSNSNAPARSLALREAEDSIGYPPEAFEHDVNIMFRVHVLAPEPLESGIAQRKTPFDPIRDEYHNTIREQLPIEATTLQDDFDTTVLQMPDMISNDDFAFSTPSVSSPGTWSNTSYSPASDNSPNSTYTTSDPESPSPPAITVNHHCSSCNYSCRLPGDLTKHRNRKHVRRFVCAATGCTAAFHLNADLARHTKSKHCEGGSKPHIGCGYTGCQETFSRKDNMMRHMREEHEHGGRRNKGN